MNKKVIIGLILAVIVIIVAVIGFTGYTKNNGAEENNLNNDTGNAENENTEALADSNTSINPNVTGEDVESNNTEEPSSSESKTLVVYYSAQNHTKAVAEQIAENLNADIFEIEPEEKYSDADLDWTDRDSRVSKEHDDESLRNIKLKKDTVDNWSDYDTVLIGYPIWWGTAAWPVDTFVKSNDFEGKTVIPFCTSSSSGLGQSGRLLEEEANGGAWEKGQRFEENPSNSTIKNWTNSLK